MIPSIKMTRIKKWAYAGLSIFALLQMNACSSKNAFLSSSVVPAARGYVKVKKDDNENYQIHLDVDYLAESSRLTPPRDTYVVWMETKNNATQNIGQVKTASDIFGGKHKSSLETKSSTKPTKIFLKAEDEAKVQSPEHRSS